MLVSSSAAFKALFKATSAVSYYLSSGFDMGANYTNILENNMLYDFNETLEILGDVELQSTSISDINKYNVNSFIHSN